MRSRYWRMRTLRPVLQRSPELGAERLGAPSTRTRSTPRAAAHPEWLLKDATNRRSTSAPPRGRGLRQRRPSAPGGSRRPDRAGGRATRASTSTTSSWSAARPLAGHRRAPRDPRTGATMTEANWQRYMADFMVAVRAALPSRRDRPRRALAQGRHAATCCATCSAAERRLDRRRLQHRVVTSAPARTACRRSPAGSSAGRRAAAA